MITDKVNEVLDILGKRGFSDKFIQMQIICYDNDDQISRFLKFLKNNPTAKIEDINYETFLITGN